MTDSRGTAAPGGGALVAKIVLALLAIASLFVLALFSVGALDDGGGNALPPGFSVSAPDPPAIG